MKTKNLKTLLIYGIIIGIIIFLFFFLITGTWIGHSVKIHCQNAQKRYEGTCVQALIQSLDDESTPTEDRNHAIWALGQLGEKEALETLKKYYTGEIPEKESFNQTISQYELRKAIKLIESGTNLGTWVWR